MYCSHVAKILCPDFSVNEAIKEGMEPEEFWTLFDGGKTEYSSMKELGFPVGFEPRLFVLTNAHGYMHMKELYNFMQPDLNNNDVMLLDAFKSIYVWEGLKSNKFERNAAAKKIDAYMQGLTDGRDPKSVQIVQVEPCCEPPSFTIHFPEWEDDFSQTWL